CELCQGPVGRGGYPDAEWSALPFHTATARKLETPAAAKPATADPYFPSVTTPPLTGWMKRKNKAQRLANRPAAAQEKRSLRPTRRLPARFPRPGRPQPSDPSQAQAVCAQ